MLYQTTYNWHYKAEQYKAVYVVWQNANYFTQSPICVSLYKQYYSNKTPKFVLTVLLYYKITHVGGLHNVQLEQQN